MDDQQVGLAITRRRIRVALGDPAHVRVEAVLGGQGGAKAIEYALLGGMITAPAVSEVPLRRRAVHGVSAVLVLAMSRWACILASACRSLH